MRNWRLLSAALVTGMGVLAGCETNKVTEVGPEARQAITAAATAKYPGEAIKSEDVQLAAINYPEKHMIEVHNLGTQSITSPTVWVNGTFMSRVDSIPPKSFVAVKYGELLEAGPAANDLRRLKEPVAKVEIQTDKGLFSVQGPTVKHE
jgi:hypothetical protein